MNRVRKTPLAKLKRDADKLCGDLVRSRGKCDRCQKTYNLQWAHIISRRYYHTRWLPQNGLCLCSGCHFMFTNNHIMWMKYLMDKYQETFNWLYIEKSNTDKIDRAYMEKVINDLKEYNDN